MIYEILNSIDIGQRWAQVAHPHELTVANRGCFM